MMRLPDLECKTFFMGAFIWQLFCKADDTLAMYSHESVAIFKEKIYGSYDVE